MPSASIFLRSRLIDPLAGLMPRVRLPGSGWPPVSPAFAGGEVPENSRDRSARHRGKLA